MRHYEDGCHECGAHRVHIDPVTLACRICGTVQAECLCCGASAGSGRVVATGVCWCLQAVGEAEAPHAHVAVNCLLKWAVYGLEA